MSRYPLSGTPYAIATSPTGATFVTLGNANAVARFSIATPATLLSPIALEPYVIDVILDRAGTTAFVSSRTKVSVLDVSFGEVKFTVPVTLPYRLALSGDERRVFATAAQGKVWSLPASVGGAPPVSITLPRIDLFEIATSPSGKSLYVAAGNQQIWRLDPATLAVQATNDKLGVQVGSIVVSPDEKELYVTVDSGVLWVLDAVTLAPIASVSVDPGSLTMTITPDGEQLWVSSWAGRLTIVDRTKRAVTRTIQLGGLPRNVAFDKLGTTALVVNGSDWVDVIK